MPAGRGGLLGVLLLLLLGVGIWGRAAPGARLERADRCAARASGTVGTGRFNLLQLRPHTSLQQAQPASMPAAQAKPKVFKDVWQLRP